MKVTLKVTEEAQSNEEFEYHVIYKNGDDIR